jgi:hypothetical protein
MKDIKKTHKEIIALYKLENSMRDIYVEGNSDKVFIENFLRAKQQRRKVILIEIVDFSGIEPDYLEGLDMDSNKNKVLVLSKLIADKVPNTSVRCIVDRDFDEYVHTIDNNKLFRTDFSCLESYLYCEAVIDKFAEMGIGEFPFASKFVLNQLQTVLKSLFCLRLLRELNFKPAKLVEISNNLVINKSKGTIGFNEDEYLEKFILKNSLATKRQDIRQKYFELKGRLNLEIRHHMNGHDFLEILFLYINKIKNTQNYRQENFCRSIFLTVEPQMVENYSLFRKIAISY